MISEIIEKNFGSYLTIRDILRILTSGFNQSDIFFGHGYLDAVSEAWALISYDLRLPFTQQELFLDCKLSKQEVAIITNHANKRIKQKIPLAYISKEAWLSGFHFLVEPNTIVPRSLLAKPITQRLAPWLADDYQCLDILELGCGGGSLSIIAAHAFGESNVIGVDIDKNAIRLANKNVEKYNLNDRIKIIQSDLFAKLPTNKFNLIISNPPYLVSSSIKKLPQEYQFEPQLALDGGSNGLVIITKIIKQAAKWLTPDGFLLLEIGGNYKKFCRYFPRIGHTLINNDANQPSIILISYQDLIR